MRDNEAAIIAVADQLGGHFAARDVDGIARLYAPDATIWHNNDGITQSAAENLAGLGSLFSCVEQIGYRDVRRTILADGVVQQHILFGRAHDGREFAMPICMILKIKDGQIIRMEEYLDPAPLLAVLAGH